MIALAWRNIWRHRGRSLLTVGVVVFIVALVLICFGLMEALKSGIFEMVTKNTGYLVVRVQNWRDLREFDALLIGDASAKRAAIEHAVAGGMLGNAEVSQVLEVPALLAGDQRSRGVQLLGTDASVAATARYAKDFLVQGRLPARGQLEEIALGRALASAVQAAVGQTIYIFAPGTQGQGAMAFKIVGLLNYPDNALEARIAYLSLAGAQLLAAPGAVSKFEVWLSGLKRISDEAMLGQSQARISSALGSKFSVETWREANPEMGAYLELLGPWGLIFAAIFFVLAGLLVVNTVYLSLIERIREFGVIIAVGADRWQVMGMVLLESLWLVLTGAVVGGVIGLGSVALLGRGFSMPFGMVEVYEALGLPLVLYPEVTTAQVLATFGLAIGTAILSAVWPPGWLGGSSRSSPCDSRLELMCMTISNTERRTEWKPC